MSNSNALLHAEKLTCIREDRILFEELSCQFDAGDIVQIAGPNGAGKTSLLRILAGLSQPYEGEVLYKNTPLSKNIELYNQNLTYIGHLAGVKGEMSAQENLEFYLAMHGQQASEAENTLANVNLLGFEDALASHLSAGQHRRIALARLWQCPKPIWILDEPFTAIDKQGVKNLESLFIEHADNGGCVILTTHQDLSIDASRIKTIELAYQLV